MRSEARPPITLPVPKCTRRDAPATARPTPTAMRLLMLRRAGGEADEVDTTSQDYRWGLFDPG